MITLNDAKCLMWGTYGKSGKDPLKVIKLDDCDIQHLKNICINLEERDDDDKTVLKYIEAVKLIIKNRLVFSGDENLFKME